MRCLAPGLVASLALALAFAFALAWTACGPTSIPTARVERAQSNDLSPAALVPTPTPGTKSVFRVRVYADDAHRAQIQNWERRVTLLLRRSTEVLSPTAGIELELVDARQWTRKATNMDAMLAELEDLDPGGDVHLVVGLTDSLPGVTSTFDQLGVARVLGKHIVMRGLNDAKEVAVLEAALTRYPAEARKQLYERRGAHKLTVTFLHELGHALGGIHTREENNILAPTYDIKQSAFSKDNAQILRIAATFRAKLGDPTSRAGELKALAAFLDSKGAAGWIAEEAVLMRKIVDESTPSALDRSTLSDLSERVRPDHRRLYRSAMVLADKGKAFEAWEQTEPLIDFYPDEPAVAVLACRLSAARRAGADVVKKWCSLAVKLAPGDITPTLTLALADIKAATGKDASKNVAKAALTLGAARSRLLAIGGQPTDTQKASWLKLAQAYRQLGLVSLAADAAARTDGGDEISKWASTQIGKYSVPALDWKGRGKKFPASADGEYLATVKAALRQVYAKDFPGALKAAAAADKRFGKTPGMETVRCDLEVRRRKYKVALKRCNSALKMFEGGGWTHYLTGLLHKQGKRPAAAVAHLERAIEIDPTLRHAYEILADIFDDNGAVDKARALREGFKKRFGNPL